MSNHETEECCPRFNPEPWDGKVVTWDEKPFLQDRVRSIFHIPLNFGAVMKRSVAAIEAADACAEEPIVLSDENSLWGADVYVAVSKPVPGAKMAALSGRFLSKVFEGPYRNMRTWIEEMMAHVQREGETLGHLYFYYTTCPRCAKKYGKNYVVLLAKVGKDMPS